MNSARTADAVNYEAFDDVRLIELTLSGDAAEMASSGTYDGSRHAAFGTGRARTLRVTTEKPGPLSLLLVTTGLLRGSPGNRWGDRRPHPAR